MQHFELTWNGGMEFVGTTPSGHKVLVDSTPDKGGGDKGPRPMELLIVGLAGCTAMDVIFILRRMREKVQEFKVEIDTEREESHPKVYKSIHIKYLFKGENLSEKNIKRAIDLSQDVYCSASATFKRSGATVTYSYEIKS
ncbi:MAG: osmotically inducible protein OsmC [Caldiserica bacterium]|nr:MAG: osmotically inducible protein OsmC [Caldisericota bacterium]